MGSTAYCLKNKPLLFGTKAETLERLAPVLTTAQVLPLEYFTTKTWLNEAETVISTLRARGWLELPLAVRSSTLSEDSATGSQAGHFLSLLNVRGEEALREAISKVIDSYKAENPSDQVLIQPMLTDTCAAGVAFTCDPNCGGPYRVINYDEAIGNTASVTSGANAALRCYYHHFAMTTLPNGFLGQVLKLCDELDELFNCPVDIEFAVTQKNELILLQARPLVTATPRATSTEAHALAVSRIEQKIAAAIQPHPYLYGSRAVFGVMPDWNPAEIIGIRPHPLALSLYRELVTDAIWAYQRDNYGYRNLRGFPLLHDFEGLPYIDVRVSFNSFIPKELNASVGQKLVEYYVDRLVADPSLHDKVEFAIVFTCHTLDLHERLEALKAYGFTNAECEEIAHSLTELTKRIVDRDTGIWRKDIAKIELLEQKQKLLLEQKLDPISSLYWLVEDCKRYGTLPFAGLARAGFIAVQMLKSFVEVGILCDREYQAFLASINSVSSRMSEDFGRLSREEFLLTYGHLRPGTYDILSSRYDEIPDTYFDWSSQKNNSSKETFTLSLAQLRNLQDYIRRDKLPLDALELLEFIKTAIEAREYSKFVFTRSVSDFMKQLEHYAAGYGIKRADLAYADLRDILALYSRSDDPKDMLSQSIEKGRKRFKITQGIRLPPLIVQPSDVWGFNMPSSAPNYITQQCAEARIAFAQDAGADLNGAIVFIPSADPGFDWIFSHNIAGLITTYGGVNSHMAIRAGEQRIPAVIGAGEVLYNQWAKASVLHLDCMNQHVRIIR